MNKKILLILAITGFCYTLAGQRIDDFLLQVAYNNPELIAYNKLLEARRYEAKTGLTPPGPAFSFGYMPGQEPGTGNKKTWSVTQSFSFPLKYINRSRLSREMIVLAEQEYDLVKLNILLETKYLVLDYIYNSKKIGILGKRKELYDRLRSSWQKMLDSGEATTLEYNRILLALSSNNLDMARTKTDLSLLREKLSYAGGGVKDIPEFIDYPDVIESNPESIIETKKSFHPAFLIPETEYRVSLGELKLARNEGYPEFQAGYASEIVPGETYTGPVAGFTIPLWANSNKVKTSMAMANHMASMRDALLAGLSTEVRGEIEKLNATGKTIEELRAMIDGEKNREFLDKALSSGEISVTDYFLYLESSFETEDRLLELDNEYNKIAASVYDQELLKLTGR